jgi:CubicO group peptidase (beta-lactamase class C family)
MTNKTSRMNIRPSLLVGVTLLAVVVFVCGTRAQTNTNPGNKEVAWPDTRAGRWAKAYVEAYNAPGKDPLRRFVKEYFSEVYLWKNPVEKVVSDHFQTRGMLKELDVHSVCTDGDFVVSVIVPAEPYGWAEFRIELSPEAPHDITNLRIGPTFEPAAKTRTAKDFTEWQNLRDLVEQVRQEAGAPAIVAAIVRGFHLGSVTKSITATMIGKLVEDGVLRWHTTVGEALRDISMRAEYRSVTLEQLLQHRGGVRAMCSTGEFAKGDSTLPQRSPPEARAALVRQVLSEEPFKMGEYAYSNAGYVVAAYMAERVAKRSWEELMRSLVFEPLELRSTGFGWPATLDRLNQPLGHYGTPQDLTVQEIGDNPSRDNNYYGPAGNVHCSIEDLARFVGFHLQGLNGRDGALRADTVRRLHTPAEGGHYMGGWGIRDSKEGMHRHGHEGTGGTFFAEITLYPDADLAIVAATNCGPSVEPFLEKMKEAILRRTTLESSAICTDDAIEWPDTIAARRARAFVEAMNSGDKESMRRFMTANYSPASLQEKSIEGEMKIPLGIRAQMGKLTVSSVKVIDERSVAFVCKGETLGIWLEFTVKVKKEPPHYWSGVTCLPTAPPLLVPSRSDP